MYSNSETRQPGGPAAEGAQEQRTSCEVSLLLLDRPRSLWATLRALRKGARTSANPSGYRRLRRKAGISRSSTL